MSASRGVWAQWKRSVGPAANPHGSPAGAGARPARPQPVVPSNDEVVRALQEMSLFLQMAEIEFKPRAHERAAHALAALEEPLSETWPTRPITSTSDEQVQRLRSRTKVLQHLRSAGKRP